MALALAFVAGLAASAPPFQRPRPARHATPRHASPGEVRALDWDRRIDVNRVNMWTTNSGGFAWDLASGNAGLVWPRGSGQTAVFASGLWLGATVGPDVRVTVAEYSTEFNPGAMVGGTFDTPNRADYVTYKMARWTGNPADSEHVVRSPAELAADPQLDPLLHHSWSEYIAGAVPYGAPTRIYRLPVTATPNPTDSVDVVGPDVIGDQMLWAVYNDADPSLHFNNAGNTSPLGVEVQQTTFAFDRSDDFGDVVFLRFKILNKGGNTLSDLHISLWSDPDVGTSTDDLVGCDVLRSLGFAYNAQPIDGIYGSPVPAVGYLLLRGPLSPANGQPLGMTAFSKYINGTDPNAFQETFNYMHGLLPDGSTLINPVTGLPTTYFVDGDPITATGWIDAIGADRRFLVSSGPTHMQPGETQEVWAAIMVGRGSDYIQSVGTVRCIADLARLAYQQGFSPLPIGPGCSSGPTPALISLVSADASSDRVALRWYTDQPGFAADVERRAEGADWSAVGRVTTDGGGMLWFEDRGVTPGARYDYRLAASGPGGIEYLGQVTVEVPATAVLAFGGAWTLTGNAPLGVSFSLATHEPVRIEVLDVAGRRVFARELTGLDPGGHTLALGEGVRFPSGIYLVRIVQGGRLATGKAAILR